MIKPTKGNINLMISIEQVENLLRGMQALNKNSTTKCLKRLSNFSFELCEIQEKEEARFHELDLIQLLEAPLGMYYALNNLKTGTKQDIFRVELKQKEDFWEIDNE